jgi:hypothetical protein
LVSHPYGYADPELDMNDPDTLGFYTQLQLFRNNPEVAVGAVLEFPPTLSPQQRRIIYSLATQLNLDSSTCIIDQDRLVRVSKINYSSPT